MIMQAAFTTTRPMASEAGSAPTGTADTLMPSYDMRRMGLENASQRLHASRGDLGEVFEARAKADIFYCPVCPEPHVA